MQVKSFVREVFAVLNEIVRSPSLRTAGLFVLPYAGLLFGLDIAAHYGELTDAPLPRQFFLASDGGFGEWFEYSLTGAISIMLFGMWLRDRSGAYFANAVLFVWLTLDNSLELHERFGLATAPLFAGYSLPVRANDVGETLLFGAVGGFWLVTLLLSLRGARLRPAAEALILAGCIGATAFFGVVVDLLVVWGQHTAFMREFETFVEDGGEFAMICVTFLMAVPLYDAMRRTRLARGSAADVVGGPFAAA